MDKDNMHWLRVSDWVLEETEFEVLHQAKCESIMHQANGRIGLRAALEENYPYQMRGTFLAGIYDRVDNEPCEIPNSADMTGMNIVLDGCCFSMQVGSIENYSRILDIRTGELKRSLLWCSPKNLRYRLVFRRFVSEVENDSYSLRVEIHPLDASAEISIITGIDGRMTNSGAQHFSDDGKAVQENRFMLLTQKLMRSGQIIINGSVCNVSGNCTSKQEFLSSRRRVMSSISAQTAKNGSVIMEKLCIIRKSEGMDVPVCTQEVINRLKTMSEIGYENLFQEHLSEMQKFWGNSAIEIGTSEPFISAAIHYSQHLLHGFMPRENDISIGAKGLSGEGYKGHVFWDVECFLLPYYIYTQPDVARMLLMYRIRRLDQAWNNARLNGYRGIMFPWESADTGYDETPLQGRIDIATGKTNKILSGLKEHHITADVALMLWKYICITGDKSILDEGGLQLIVGAALFWKSRAKWDEQKNLYQIIDVVGPDEYSECVDNNAYTNYTACSVVRLACQLLEEISPERTRLLESQLCERIQIQDLMKFADLLYLPGINANGIIPQDDTFLQGKVIDLTVYRKSLVRQTILNDYSRAEINRMQVSKQADVVMLFSLFPELFSREIQLTNWYYYEKRTVHDSSLSCIVYAMVAARLGIKEEAIANFRNALDVDLSVNPYSSSDGIHAAAAGGICNGVIAGFAGIYLNEEGLEISPMLPDEIQSIRIPLRYRGNQLRIKITRQYIDIENNNDSALSIRVFGRHYVVCRNLRIEVQL